MELPPAVVVAVEEAGLQEEQQDVGKERRGEHAHQVVRELRVQRDEHEREERPEGRGHRERDREELGELVGEPVVAPIPRLVADHLDEHREDRDGKDERREQEVELRHRPDGDAAADDGEGPVLGLDVRLGLGAAVSAAALSASSPAARGVGSTTAAGARYGSRYSRLVRNVAINTTAPNITRPVTGPSTNSSFRLATPFILPPPSTVPRRLGRRSLAVAGVAAGAVAEAGALAARACRSRWSSRT